MVWQKCQQKTHSDYGIKSQTFQENHVNSEIGISNMPLLNIEPTEIPKIQTKELKRLAMK